MITYSPLILASPHSRPKIFYYILMTCFATILILFFIIFPVLLLFFDPTKAFRNLLSKCCSSRLRIFLNIFIEKFHCCYRDGLDGTKNMRSFSGIYFVLRIIIYSAEAVTRATFNFDSPLVQEFILSVTALLIAISRPYKRTYTNIMDSILLLHMATRHLQRLLICLKSTVKVKFYGSFIRQTQTVADYGAIN